MAGAKLLIRQYIRSYLRAVTVRQEFVELHGKDIFVRQGIIDWKDQAVLVFIIGFSIQRKLPGDI